MDEVIKIHIDTDAKPVSDLGRALDAVGTAAGGAAKSVDHFSSAADTAGGAAKTASGGLMGLAKNFAAAAVPADKALESFKAFSPTLGGVVEASSGVIQSLGGLGKAFAATTTAKSLLNKVLQASALGLILTVGTAVVAVLSKLGERFLKSTELVEKFEAALNTVYAVFESMVNIVGNFGKTLVSSLASGDSLFGALKKSVLGAKSEIEKLPGVTAEVFKSFESIAKLEKEISGELAKSVEAQSQQMAELKEKLDDTSLSVSERIKLASELGGLEASSLQKQIELQEKLLESIKKVNEATGGTTETIEKQKAVESKLAELKSRSAAAEKESKERLRALNNEAAAAAAAYAERLKAVNEAIKDIQKTADTAKFELSLLDLDESQQQLARFDKEFKETIASLNAQRLEVEGATAAQIAAFEREKQEAISSYTELYEKRRAALVESTSKELAQKNFDLAVDSINKISTRETLALTQNLERGLISRAEYESKTLELSLSSLEKQLAAAEKYGMDTEAIELQISNTRILLREKELEKSRSLLDLQVKELERAAELELSEIQRQVDFGVVYESDAALKRIEIQRNLIQKKLELAEAGSEAEAELMQKLSDLDSDMALALISKRRADTERAKEAFNAQVSYAQEAAGKIAEIMENSFSTFSRFAEISSQKSIAEIESIYGAQAQAINEALENNVISQAEANEALANIEAEKQKKLADEKRKAAEIDKAMQIASAVMTAAQATLAAYASGVATPLVGPATGAIYAAIAAAFGAAQIAAISATPLPQFAEGVIDLKGPGTEKSDSIVARLSKGESVMTAHETRLFLPTLKAIRDGSVNPQKLNAFATSKTNNVSVTVNVDESGFQVMEYNGIKRINYLDKRVKFYS